MLFYYKQWITSEVGYEVDQVYVERYDELYHGILVSY